MSDPKTQEPSMEEILASIRRIISEDGTPEDQAAAPAPVAAAPPPPPPAAAPPPPAAMAAPEPIAEDVLELTEPMDDDKVVNLAPPEDERIPPLFEEQRGRAMPEPPPPPQPRAPFEGLVSPPQADRTVGMFSELHDRLSGPETPIGAGYKTLEQMTIEVMRPMLKDWLDTHLPGMVERLVQEEIERMVHRATQPRR